MASSSPRRPATSCSSSLRRRTTPSARDWASLSFPVRSSNSADDSSLPLPAGTPRLRAALAGNSAVSRLASSASPTRSSSARACSRARASASAPGPPGSPPSESERSCSATRSALAEAWLARCTESAAAARQSASLSSSSANRASSACPAAAAPRVLARGDTSGSGRAASRATATSDARMRSSWRSKSLRSSSANCAGSLRSCCSTLSALARAAPEARAQSASCS
mmetsp:Transcript_102571/g.290086  ORF Transcript_102571/g.290086 Transcript_102571/m.290086 type:complete len:225 (+) Transcript_102571:193-867(+)